MRLWQCCSAPPPGRGAGRHRHHPSPCHATQGSGWCGPILCHKISPRPSNRRSRPPRPGPNLCLFTNPRPSNRPPRPRPLNRRSRHHPPHLPRPLPTCARLCAGMKRSGPGPCRGVLPPRQPARRPSEGSRCRQYSRNSLTWLSRRMRTPVGAGCKPSCANTRKNNLLVSRLRLCPGPTPPGCNRQFSRPKQRSSVRRHACRASPRRPSHRGPSAPTNAGAPASFTCRTKKQRREWLPRTKHPVPWRNDWPRSKRPRPGRPCPQPQKSPPAPRP